MDVHTSRRRLVQGCGVTLLGGLAGCLGSDDDSGGGDGGGNGDGSVGTAEITFLGETYTFDDASCAGRRTFPPENELIHYRDYGTEFEFWVERHDPEESDTVSVHVGFPEGGSQTIGEIESYDGQTTIDEVEFELESHTSGTAELEPGTMNDDVEHEPDGGLVERDISC